VLAIDDVPPELFWVDDSVAGLRRRRSGRGFVYFGPDDRRVTDARTLDRIRVLAIPPAWTDVWICRDSAGHLQATGRDARGRKQYRYHVRFRAHRDEAKFARLHEFGRALPAVRKQVAADLTGSGMPREKVIAAVVRLLEVTLVRVGNEEYARANKSYGLTTLRNRHAQFSSSGLQLVFRGKHSISASVRIQDQRLRRVVKQCQDLPGQVLFQYLDADGEARPVSSTDVNTYLNEVSGESITAKDFRTWTGTLLATVALAELPPPPTERASKRSIARVLEVVSNHLGNTPAVCRASYVHPEILDAFESGVLQQRWEMATARGSRLLVPEERRLLQLLRPRRKRAERDRANAA
jgi:DNA topoisomerase I